MNRVHRYVQRKIKKNGFYYSLCRPIFISDLLQLLFQTFTFNLLQNSLYTGILVKLKQISYFINLPILLTTRDLWQLKKEARCTLLVLCKILPRSWVFISFIKVKKKKKLQPKKSTFFN